MPRAWVVGMAVAGVVLRVMGIGPAPVAQEALVQTGLAPARLDVIERDARGVGSRAPYGHPGDVAHAAS